MKSNKASRISRRQGTKAPVHKECQTQTKGAAARARKTMPAFYQVTVVPRTESESS